jgi:electron transfer flavoprotein beta subunit
MKPLQIIVCAKQIPDPEGPADAFQVDPEAKKVIPVGIPPVINPFDENALEAALQIKKEFDSKITVLSMGEKLAQPVLKKALAAGADDLILLMDDHFKDLDSYSTAYVLSEAIKKIGAYDMILTGRQAGDWDFGVTGLLIAEILQIPTVNLARKIEVRGDWVFVEKLCEDGYEVVKSKMPLLVTVSSEVGELRYVSIQAFRAVSKKPVKILNAGDLELDLKKLTYRTILNLYAFHDERQCRLIEGESAEEKGAKLALTLRQDRVI